MRIHMTDFRKSNETLRLSALPAGRHGNGCGVREGHLYRTHVNNTLALSLTELMVVVMVLGLIAGFGIPNYTRAIERAHVRDARTQLTALWSANQVYRSQTGSFWPTTNNQNIASINTNLGMSMIPNGMIYDCDGNGATYSCSARRTWNAGTYTMTLTPTTINYPQDAGADNPACTGACP